MLFCTAGAQRAVPHQGAHNVQEIGSLAAAGCKKLKQSYGSSSRCGHLSLAGSPTARPPGAPSVKTGGRRQSHGFSWGTSHPKGLRRDFKLLLLEPPWSAAVEGGQEPLRAEPLCQPSLQRNRSGTSSALTLANF